MNEAVADPEYLKIERDSIIWPFCTENGMKKGILGKGGSVICALLNLPMRREVKCHAPTIGEVKERSKVKH